MNRGFQKGLGESQSGRFVLALQAEPGKDHTLLRKETGGLPLLTWHQKAKKKCLEMGVRCDSQVLRVLGKPSLEGADPRGVIPASGSRSNDSSSERAESAERTRATDTQLSSWSSGEAATLSEHQEP